MGLKRRAFLQQMGWVLSALGLSESGLWYWGDRYRQVLAQTTPRKLALLIGINQYPQSPALSGCLTDVELQYELLRYRFGFQAQDILTLVDQQATRQNIEAAFVEHLINQAQPGDVVVIHFSGYGSQIGAKSDLQNSLVPFDSPPGSDATEVVNDLPEETLLLLLRSLRTDRICTILDTSYGGIETTESLLRGNLRVRSRALTAIGQPSPATLAFQDQLLAQISASKNQTRTARESGQMPGVVLAAVNAGQRGARSRPQGVAFEGHWNGFTSGLFTYALTQQLWGSTSPSSLQLDFSRVGNQLAQLTGSDEQPELAGQKSREKALLAYYLPPKPSTGVAGVITATEDGGKVGRLWLAGLPIEVLEYYGANSLLNLLSAESPATTSEPDPPLQVQLITRSGPIARVRPYGGGDSRLEVGQTVQEAVRVLPRQVQLFIALDSSLTRIERVDATSAFSGIAYIKAVASGEHAADCLLGKLKTISSSAVSLTVPVAPPPAAGTENAPPTPLSMEAGLVVNSAPNDSSKTPPSYYGLFTPAHRLLPHTTEGRGEAVKVAIQRLLPRLEALLALKLLRLTVNEGSSRIRVRAVLEVTAPQEQGIMERMTAVALQTLAQESPEVALNSSAELASIPVGSRIRYRLYNLGNRLLYFALLGLDSSGRAIALYSGQGSSAAEAPDRQLSLQQNVLPPHETLTIPRTSSTFEWVVREPIGLCQTLLIFSEAPFSQTLTALTLDPQIPSSSQRISTPTKPLDIAQAILQDLHQASAATTTIPASPDVFALNVNTWCTLNFTYRVV